MAQVPCRDARHQLLGPDSEAAREPRDRPEARLADAAATPGPEREYESDGFSRALLI